MTYLFGKELGYGRGMRRILPALAITLTPLLAQAQGTAENQQATFRSGVDLVTVSATVRDGKGRLVKDLTKKDFEVIDRGERRVDQRIPIRTGAPEPCDSLRRERQHGHCRSRDRR